MAGDRGGDKEQVTRNGWQNRDWGCWRKKLFSGIKNGSCEELLSPTS